MKDIVVIGGPNGAGKTRAAPAVVPQELGIREFVNADEIARGLSPFNAEGAAIAAGRLMIERMQALVRSGESFAFETTCSGRAYAGRLQKWKLQGWRVTLLFLWLPSPRAALDRVAAFLITLWCGATTQVWSTCAISIFRSPTWLLFTTTPMRDALLSRNECPTLRLWCMIQRVGR